MLNILFLITATTAAIIFFALAKSKKNEEEYEFFIVYTLIGIFCVICFCVDYPACGFYRINARRYYSMFNRSIVIS